MSKLVSIVQAAQNTLARYLADNVNNPKVLAKPASPVVVEPRWPDPHTMGPKVITIIPAGPRRDENDAVLGWWHYSERVDPQPPGLPPGMVMWRWTVAWYEQPVQLDIWCLYDIDRDDLIARLDVALHAGPGETTSYVGDPIADYLILPMSQDDGWPGAYMSADFSDEGPNLIDTGDAAGQTTYRATWRGSVGVLLTVDAPSYPIARNLFKLRMSETQVPTTGDYDLEITVSGSRPATYSASVDIV